MTKRTTLLMLFVLFGLLPVLGLLLFGIYRQTGLYVQNYAQWAEKQLGVPVQLGGIQHHTFGQGTLEAVTLFMPGTAGQSERLPLATLPKADWLEYEILRSGAERKLLRWNVPELRLSPSGLESFWNIHRCVIADAEFWATHEIAVQIDGIVYVGFDEHALELQSAELRIRSEDGIPRTEIHFTVPDTVAGATRQAQVSLVLQRIPQNTSQIMQATLATDTAGLPTRYLYGVFPMLQSLGEGCRFTGSIAIQQSFSRWSGYFRGRFDAVDVTTWFPDEILTGQATLDVEKARFDGARLMMAEGSFRMTDGTISRAFLDQILRVTQLSTRGIPLEMRVAQTFRQLAFRFQISETQMQIYGLCDGYGAGVFIVGLNGPILCEPAFLRKPFLRAFFNEMLRLP